MELGGLLERDDVVASADALLDEVAAGHSGALYVVGEAGLGKTSLIDRACDQARARGLTAGLGRGHPLETSLPFGLLTQALDGIGGPGLLGDDERELSGDGGDRAARFYTVLRWLQERAGSGIFLAFDDLHWADTDSLALISFISRRPDVLGLGLLACMRPWPPAAREATAALAHEGHGTVQVLEPLSTSASGVLLEARVGAPVPAPVVRRAFALCAGNPLLLGQVAMAIGRGEDLPAAEAAGSLSGQSMLLARFAGLPTSGMRCAQAASVLGTSFMPDVAAQLAMLDATEADTALESLSHSGLIRQDPGAEAYFVHPLIRQALYDELAVPIRTRLHARAFTVLSDRGMGALAAEHAVLAGLAGDQRAVLVLKRAGQAARRAGALAAAVTRFDEAVAMAGDGAEPDLLLAQAEALLAAGQAQRAADAYRALLDRGDLAPADRVTSLWMLGRALVSVGEHEQAAVTFAAAADLAAPSDPATAAEVLLDASMWRMRASGPGPALPAAARARDLAGRVGGLLPIRAAAVWGQLAMLSGDPEGMAAAEPACPVAAAAARARPRLRDAGSGWRVGPGQPLRLLRPASGALRGGRPCLHNGPRRRRSPRRSRGDHDAGGRPFVHALPDGQARRGPPGHRGRAEPRRTGAAAGVLCRGRQRLHLPLHRQAG